MTVRLDQLLVMGGTVDSDCVAPGVQAHQLLVVRGGSRRPGCELWMSPPRVPAPPASWHLPKVCPLAIHTPVADRRMPDWAGARNRRAPDSAAAVSLELNRITIRISLTNRERYPDEFLAHVGLGPATRTVRVSLGRTPDRQVHLSSRTVCRQPPYQQLAIYNDGENLHVVHDEHNLEKGDDAPEQHAQGFEDADVMREFPREVHGLRRTTHREVQLTPQAGLGSDHRRKGSGGVRDVCTAEHMTNQRPIC